MNRQEYLLDVIKSNVFSEKAYKLGEKNVLVFKVLPKANKNAIRDAVEQVLGIKVVSVNTLNVTGKTKRNKYGLSKHKNWKKAYVKVQLEEGKSIEDVASDIGSVASENQ
jgi:large subunit ribosomal protein L23